MGEKEPFLVHRNGILDFGSTNVNRCIYIMKKNLIWIKELMFRSFSTPFGFGVFFFQAQI